MLKTLPLSRDLREGERSLEVHTSHVFFAVTLGLGLFWDLGH